jgi:LDH2 family malate/lactate/ureidoglycolate dehydrogenase
MEQSRYRHGELIAWTSQLLRAAGLDAEKARFVAEILVEADLLGHDTHGLALLPGYLGELASGSMAKAGEPKVVADHPAAVTWDGQRLPGPWLVLKALDLAAERAKTQGTGTVVIRRSHHIACLAAYLKRATDRGLLMLLICSDPNSASVAPFGGIDAVFTPNPIAAGFPTEADPVLVDVSTSITTNAMTARLHKTGYRLPGPWALDAKGSPTDDPGVLFGDPRGTILPLGGLDAGHKGYGLTLLVEALTGGLAGHGRADAKEGWGATVFLQVIDPRAFSGSEAFSRQTGHIARACRAARPRRVGEKVRTPGERGLSLAREQRANGIALHPGILPALAPWTEKLGVVPPSAC